MSITKIPRKTLRLIHQTLISNEKLEYLILYNLQEKSLSSNELQRKLPVSKSRYTIIKNIMIKQGTIKKRIDKNRIYLSTTISQITNPIQIKCKHCFTNVTQITFIQINKKRKTD